MIALLLALTACAPEVRPAPTSAPSAPMPEKFALGRAATAEEIAAWDIDVDAEGRGLPPGKGTPAEGAVLFAQQCVACHGAKGEGGIAPKVVGAEPKTGFGEDWKDHHRTIGNWWPYATTVYDYVHRAMPQYAPGSLTPDQTYALTAFLLEQNGIVGADFIADATSLPKVKMGTKVTFVPDDRDGPRTG